MSSVAVSHPDGIVRARINLPRSKSISNRALILQALFPTELKLEHLSDAEDTILMQAALHTKEGIIDVKNAGTCMRFLTAYFACREGVSVELHGDERMAQRPLSILVDALRSIGADITYLGAEGFAPLAIKGKILAGGNVRLDASVSSQFVTALMLIAPSLEKGLTIELEGEISSDSYIKMTTELMKRLGLVAERNEQVITVATGKPAPGTFEVEPDWSAASYWYEIAAISRDCEIELVGLDAKSLQGDSVVARFMENFGVETTKTENGITLTKGVDFDASNEIILSLRSTPDLAPALCASALAQNLNVVFSGLQNLAIKESNRLKALETELKKISPTGIAVTDRSIRITSTERSPAQTLQFETYSDHRMAMALAPLGLWGEVEIADPDVVVKSYPAFWEDLRRAGFVIERVGV